MPPQSAALPARSALQQRRRLKAAKRLCDQNTRRTAGKRGNPSKDTKASKEKQPLSNFYKDIPPCKVCSEKSVQLCPAKPEEKESLWGGGGCYHIGNAERNAFPRHRAASSTALNVNYPSTLRSVLGESTDTAGEWVNSLERQWERRCRS